MPRTKLGVSGWVQDGHSEVSDGARLIKMRNCWTQYVTIDPAGQAWYDDDTEARCQVVNPAHPTNAYLVSWIPRIFSLKNSMSRNP